MKAAELTPDNCDTEPVHIPGCIQPHGVLLVLRRSDFTILQVSDNSARWLGKGPQALIGGNVRELVGAVNADCLQATLARESLENNPRYVFSFSPTHVAAGAGPLDVTAHLAQGRLVLEMERTGRTESVQGPDAYGMLKGAIARLQTAATLRDFCHFVAEEVAKLTGLDRVMIYRFADDDSGWVFAETRREGVESFLDLHYPAVDIPKPAREIFSKIWLRSLPDIHHEPAELLPVLNPDTGNALDMTYCFLRGASTMYTDYLRNMGVRMSCTMSIMREDRLWGMIACHHNAPQVLGYQVRAICELLAQVVSLQIKSAEEREHVAYKERLQAGYCKLLTRELAEEEADLSRLITCRPNLLDFIPAGGAALHCEDKSWTLGDVPDQAQREHLVAWLSQTQGGPGAKSPRAAPPSLVYQTHALAKDYSPAAGYQNVASGVLAVPVSGSGKDWLLWFRPEVAHTVKWGGNPNDKPIVQGPHGPRLMPRTSFEIWKETVRGESLPWQPLEIEAAAKLRFTIMEIVVGHAETVARLNRELAASNAELDSFAFVASHDLKEPLRGIYHYGQSLVESSSGKLDADAQIKLARLLSLTRRMDALIDSLLHYSRVGRVELQMDEVDLNALLDEGLELLAVSRRDKKVSVRVPRPLPVVRCDSVRVRELLVNLVSNAIKYNDKAECWVEIGYGIEGSETVFHVRDNGIGIPGQFHEQIFRMYKRLHGRDEFGGGIGAGLTICRKTIERHGGRIWVDSTPGRGATFFFTLGSRPT